jgi:hypothetical protein
MKNWMSASGAKIISRNNKEVEQPFEMHVYVGGRGISEQADEMAHALDCLVNHNFDGDESKFVDFEPMKDKSLTG